ncbi:topoisomerase II-associated protein PAT1 [Pyrenophora tritici-repentis]|nr:Topoisomerase II-associated protein PAT1 [Pyrenophora tritici-repentis]KAF7442427.1 Topoisomerase II-associated protein [Pyrenophora tritici-repentis]KAG9378129.1 Topoisomerase II-associated protein PAT1 [Pyrenophora tritici-repentis]KAI1550050.1 topoisomerase II-associated protein PAT1 [Pyrenophora tritici-repentis]KAI1552944.1 topoisomerase II-associated protein PAT1 [Pyrenophora tritici-repentis]
MSFFGFDTSLPRDHGHASNAPGFGQHDAFAALGGGAIEGDVIDFEETYDGLGDQLDDEADDLNDDTFGGGPATQQSVGKHFDFAGQTSMVSSTLQEEQMLYQARNQASKPNRTGYESYKDPEYIPQLEARADIWGLKPKASASQQQQQSSPQPAMATQQAPPSRKVMSMEEVEAMMRAQSIGNDPRATPPILQRPQQQQHSPQVRAELPDHPIRSQPPQQPTILQRQRPQSNEHVAQQQRQGPPQPQAQGPSGQPRHILQNPNRLSGQGQPMVQTGPQAGRGQPAAHNRGPSFPGMVITHPEQLLQLSEAERAAFLEEDAKRAKRNHKIALLAKDNGLMTPQDKNFITRIQLQQLMTATGNLEERGPEAAIAEDFYYQVFSQIRGAPRHNPQQPASQFAQTYLFQTNNRFGARRQGRGGDNHMQRMEQQIQRAVEAAKARPKARQLVVEGSLGKIAFSNSKTPRPLLNLKRPETNDKLPKSHKSSIADRKEALRNIEAVYRSLMQMEDHERAMPPPIQEGSPPEAIQAHMEWRSKIDVLHEQLWSNTKIMEPINPSAPHPFISILSHAKGKKVIPRLFRHINEQERITVVTMIVVHLDALSVVGHAIATPDEPLSAAIREEVDLFSQTVMSPIHAHISDAPLNIVIGLLGLVLDRTNLHVVARSKIGLTLLTFLISRAELLKQSAPEMVTDWQQWTNLYNRLFDVIEPVLPYLFPGSINDTDDMYIWQFLAAMGVGASPEQQQRLVLGVKDRVMETVAVSKALPADMASARTSNVNLFMRAIGLDVELLG